LPASASVLGAVDAAGGDGDPHAIAVRLVEDDRVQAQAAAARLPLPAVRVVEQALVQRPGLAGVIRAEQGRRLDTRVQSVRLLGAAGNDLPDALERNLRAFGKADGHLLGV